MNAGEPSTPSFAERMKVYLPNRSRFPLDRLAQYAGQWVAFRADGLEIVANAPDFERLEHRLTELGIAPQDVVSEYVDDGSICIGGAEFQ